MADSSSSHMGPALEEYLQGLMGSSSTLTFSLSDKFSACSQDHFQMLFVFASVRADGPDKEGKRGPLNWASLGTLPLALSNNFSEPAA
ncbi:hypothetical protein DPX16_7583 [Anabarilius grahami]|uniref:Uncharacterized protein n=1 Tax=Anabarilius grahami TaxID=495550 RepID=A0A3N0YR17_ANAGA|nr:hypothetical protein DPX16_7583 [Anabarilius grahami]